MASRRQIAAVSPISVSSNLRVLRDLRGEKPFPGRSEGKTCSSDVHDKEPEVSEGKCEGFPENAGYDGHGLTVLRKVAAALNQRKED